MAYVILGAVVIALLVYLFLQDRRQERERDSYLRAINLSIQEGSQERREFRQLLSEEWTRIQRPEIARPDIRPVEPGPVPIPDPAFEKVGQIFPEGENGKEAPDNGP